MLDDKNENDEYLQEDIMSLLESEDDSFDENTNEQSNESESYDDKAIDTDNNLNNIINDYIAEKYADKLNENDIDDIHNSEHDAKNSVGYSQDNPQDIEGETYTLNGGGDLSENISDDSSNEPYNINQNFDTEDQSITSSSDKELSDEKLTIEDEKEIKKEKKIFKKIRFFAILSLISQVVLFYMFSKSLNSTPDAIVKLVTRNVVNISIISSMIITFLCCIVNIVQIIINFGDLKKREKVAYVFARIVKWVNYIAVMIFLIIFFVLIYKLYKTAFYDNLNAFDELMEIYWNYFFKYCLPIGVVDCFIYYPQNYIVRYFHKKFTLERKKARELEKQKAMELERQKQSYDQSASVVNQKPVQKSSSNIKKEPKPFKLNDLLVCVSSIFISIILVMFFCSSFAKIGKVKISFTKAMTSIFKKQNDDDFNSSFDSMNLINIDKSISIFVCVMFIVLVIVIFMHIKQLISRFVSVSFDEDKYAKSNYKVAISDIALSIVQFALLFMSKNKLEKSFTGSGLYSSSFSMSIKVSMNSLLFMAVLALLAGACIIASNIIAKKVNINKILIKFKLPASSKTANSQGNSMKNGSEMPYYPQNMGYPQYNNYNIPKQNVPQNASKKPNYKELEMLKEMLDKGLITQEDYDAKKKKILGI